MVARPDVFERAESLQKPLILSLVLHTAVFGLVAIYEARSFRPGAMWGSPGPGGGGAVSITPVSKIPLPGRQGMLQPVAHDTPSRVPAPPKPVARQRAASAEDQTAIPIPERTPARRAPIAQSSVTRSSAASSVTSEQPHQLYSSSGAAVSSPIYGAPSSGSGPGTGIGSSNPFGERFGYYVELLRQRVASRWDTSRVDPRLQSAPPVVLAFDILRDGRIRNLRFLQRSGHPDLDFSAQRAILEASPFPPLPRGFEREYATIEFWFELRR